MKFTRACLTEPRKFEFFDVDESPNEDQVLIKIAGCGLCNWELNFWDGTLNFMGYPHKLGHEFAGVIEEVGTNIEHLKVGDKVTAVDRGFGGFAEYRVTNASACIKLNDDLDPKYAMGEPQKCILTVLGAIEPYAGDYGVVVGCGPMGLWCVQGLKGKLLAGLIAVDIDDKKLALAKKFGATHIINSSNEDVNAHIKEITQGHMADFVIEGTGLPKVLDEAQIYLKMGRGKLILMSSHHEPSEKFDFRKSIDRGNQIIVAHPPFAVDESDDFRRAVSLINNGTFKNKELVTHEFKLSEIQKAFETLENKPGNFIKGIVYPD